MDNIKYCSICNISEKDTSKFYYNSKFGENLCNKHYIQLRRYGEINDPTPNIKPKDYCEICGDKNDIRRFGKKGECQGKYLCTKHYRQALEKGEIVDATPSHRDRERVCEVCGNSEGEIIFCNKTQQMLCRKHYDHVWNFGKVLERTVFEKNTFNIKEDTHGKFAEIILRNKEHEEVAKTTIDFDDLNKVLERVWGYSSSWGYVTSGSQDNFIMLQNFILNQKGLIDHIDRNPLNNRKYNLIPSNKSLNALNCGLRKNNKSGVTGVSYEKKSDLWRVYINWQGNRIELGYKENINDAIKLRLLKECELLGDLAPQRHLFQQYNIIEKEI